MLQSASRGVEAPTVDLAQHDLGAGAVLCALELLAHQSDDRRFSRAVRSSQTNRARLMKFTKNSLGEPTCNGSRAEPVIFGSLYRSRGVYPREKGFGIRCDVAPPTRI